MNKFSRVLLVAVFVMVSSALFMTCETAQKKFESQSPAFTLDYPKGYTMGKPINETELLRVHGPIQGGNPTLTVTVVDLAKDSKLEDAAEGWVDSVQKQFPAATRFKILSENIITLNDGTKASEYLISWRWVDGMTMLTTSAVTAYKGGKAVSISATCWQSPVEELVKLTHALKFK
jgi:hypothetical protein